MCLGALLVALLLPISAQLTNCRSDLAGKKIVVNKQGHLDWRRPSYDSYGRQSAGQYGMLPVLVESLGGHLVLSEGFSAEDLKDADLVVWLYPAAPVPPAQYERIWDFVRHGGSLLVVTGPFLGDGGPAEQLQRHFATNCHARRRGCSDLADRQLAACLRAVCSSGQFSLV